MHKVLIYLHGFLSSPHSVKCRAVGAYVAKHHPDIEFVAPQIPNYPQRAVSKLRCILQHYRDQQIGYVGSSMGGFMATHLMQDYPGKAVLVNPAVKPDLLLQHHLGEHTHPHTAQNFVLTSEHILQLKHLFVAQLRSPENYWVLLQKNDEILDYRLAVDRYQSGQLTVEDGGDHSFQGFAQYLRSIIAFLYPATANQRAAGTEAVSLLPARRVEQKDSTVPTELYSQTTTRYSTSAEK